MVDLRLFLPKRPPLPLIAVACVAVFGSFVPLALILHHSQVYHERPRIHLFQDMDNQPKLKAQAASPIFADGRAMRPPVNGTIARGQLQLAVAGPLTQGVTNPEAAENPDFVVGYPEGVEVNEDFLAKGRETFNTFCYPCHGVAGQGNGPVNQRAMALVAGDGQLSWGTAWAPSANLQAANDDGSLVYGPDAYPNGQLYNVIAHGKNNMAGYAHAIPVEDRWAVVAYVRALQLSQNPQQMTAALDRADATAGLNADPRSAAR